MHFAKPNAIIASSLALCTHFLILDKVSSWSNGLNRAVATKSVGSLVRASEKIAIDPATALQEALDRAGVIRFCDIGPTKYGRGLVARRDMDPGDVVFRLPLSETTAVEISSSESSISISDAWAGRLAQKLVERQKETNSGTTIANSYKKALPKPPPTPSRGDWSIEALETLESKDILREIKVAQDWRNEQWEVFGVSDGALGDQQRFLDALDLVSSRTIRCGDKFMLVPFLDMANYASRDQGGGYYALTRSSKEDEEMIELRIGDRGVKAGGEIFLDYGDRTNNDWLLYYGFLPDRNSAESVILPNSQRIITWDEAGSEDKGLKDECQACLDCSSTTLQEDYEALGILEKDIRNNDTTLILALKYRIARKTLLSAVAGAKASSAFSSAFL